jgi:hypothetical protein
LRYVFVCRYLPTDKKPILCVSAVIFLINLKLYAMPFALCALRFAAPGLRESAADSSLNDFNPIFVRNRQVFVCRRLTTDKKPHLCALCVSAVIVICVNLRESAVKFLERHLSALIRGQ